MTQGLTLRSTAQWNCLLSLLQGAEDNGGGGVAGGGAEVRALRSIRFPPRSVSLDPQRAGRRRYSCRAGAEVAQHAGTAAVVMVAAPFGDQKLRVCRLLRATLAACSDDFRRAAAARPNLLCSVQLPTGCCQ